MTSPLSRSPFISARISEIIQFAKDNPWKPIWPPEMIRDFLTSLISSQELVFDLSLHGKRASIAVLIDKIQNPANHACLEILGLSQTTPVAIALEMFLNLSKKHLCQT